MDETNHCVDDGCEQQLQGLGQCVNITSVSNKTEWHKLSSQYDISQSSPWYNQFCKPSDGSVQKDCCVCLKRRPCRDEGCYEAGGLCIDMKKAHLNTMTGAAAYGDGRQPFALAQVDFPITIEGDLCSPEHGLQSSQGSPESSCCTCYKRKSGECI